MKNSKGYYLSSKSESGEITEKQKEFIKSAQKDQMIVFEDIYAEGSNDRRKVSSIVFKIK
jgi:hypothetical protein